MEIPSIDFLIPTLTPLDYAVAQISISVLKTTENEKPIRIYTEYLFKLYQKYVVDNTLAEKERYSLKTEIEQTIEYINKLLTFSHLKTETPIEPIIQTQTRVAGYTYGYAGSDGDEIEEEKSSGLGTGLSERIPRTEAAAATAGYDDEEKKSSGLGTGSRERISRTVAAAAAAGPELQQYNINNEGVELVRKRIEKIGRHNNIPELENARLYNTIIKNQEEMFLRLAEVVEGLKIQNIQSKTDKDAVKLINASKETNEMLKNMYLNQLKGQSFFDTNFKDMPQKLKLLFTVSFKKLMFKAVKLPWDVARITCREVIYEPMYMVFDFTYSKIKFAWGVVLWVVVICGVVYVFRHGQFDEIEKMYNEKFAGFVTPYIIYSISFVKYAGEFIWYWSKEVVTDTLQGVPTDIYNYIKDTLSELKVLIVDSIITAIRESLPSMPSIPSISSILPW